MNEQNTNETTFNNLPDAVVQTRKHQLSIVWIVPLIAALIGSWLIYKTVMEKGPTIFITFNSAEGLEAGKTKIKFKNVEVGQVEDINVSPDLSQIIVRAQLVRQAKDYLSENTRFWVVRARVATSGISGLGTLFSGAYIGLDPGKPGKPTHHFNGLEVPPVVTTEMPGSHFTLKANRRSSLDINSPVYYRQIQVGKLVAYHLASDGQTIAFNVFINAPYHSYVRKNTIFWNASGLDISMDAKGVRIDTESLVSLMIGGIAFGTPQDSEPGDPAGEKDVFLLYENFEATKKKIYAVKNKYLLYFNDSVRGLSPGAPVEFRGLQVGRVLDINLTFNRQNLSVSIPVLIEIEPERINYIGGFPEGVDGYRNIDYRKKIMAFLAEKGLRAKLKTGNILLGQKFVDFDFYPNVPRTQVNWEGPYPVLPTMATTAEELSKKVTQILTKLDNLPIEQIGSDLGDTAQNLKHLSGSPKLLEVLDNLNAALKETKQLVTDLKLKTTPQFDVTLKQAQKSLAVAEATLSSDSLLHHKITNALEELAGAARSLRKLTDYLEQHPESLLYGKGK